MNSKCLALVLVFLSFGCAQAPLISQDPVCMNNDWYERGRQDGATGVQHRKEHFQDLCHNSFSTESADLYMNGFHAGLTDYCSLENAFKVGQMGGPEENHCPHLMKESFKIGYDQGVKARRLKIKNQEIARKIQNLSSQVHSRTISSVSDESLSTELENLKRQYARNQKKISEMNN